jgi:glycine/D-amino acid oxidase-like deaminating enzyme
MGVLVEVITPDDARRIVSELRSDDLVGTTFWREDGIVNPHGILNGYAKNARRRFARA